MLCDYAFKIHQAINQSILKKISNPIPGQPSKLSRAINQCIFNKISNPIPEQPSKLSRATFKFDIHIVWTVLANRFKNVK